MALGKLMKLIMKNLFILLLIALGHVSFAQRDFSVTKGKVLFSEDGLPVTVDLHMSSPVPPVIIFLHQAAWSRGEYNEIIPKLKKLGYTTCMAVDLRSGGAVNGVVNETAKAARERKLPNEYIHAIPDIKAAIDFFARDYNKKVILWGSSYSASLALLIAAEDDRVKAVLAYSPGEYFGDSLSISESISGITQPVYVTSSRKESDAVKELISGIKKADVTHFIPEEKGMHGCKTLWEAYAYNAEYWESVKAFLKEKITR